MLEITIPKREVFDTETQMFYHTDRDTTIQLEHSLISLQKWESKWHVPFLSTADKTTAQTIDYVRCMCLTQNVKPDVFYCIPPCSMDEISAYINNPMTATTIREPKSAPGAINKRTVITAEIIYYWMIEAGIPTEYRKWHLNQLMTLIRVINIKRTPPKKKKGREVLNEHRLINEANKMKYHTAG